MALRETVTQTCSVRSGYPRRRGERRSEVHVVEGMTAAGGPPKDPGQGPVLGVEAIGRTEQGPAPSCQLEHDLADFVAVVRKSASAPLTLVGYSAGGGFALRVAGSPIQNLFERTVLLAPYLGYNAPTNRPNSGGWASAAIARIVGLSLLRAIGIDCCEALPVLAFAVPPNSEKNLVPTYTDRLMRNFATHRDFRGDLAAVTKPLTIISGAADELMLADKYVEAVRGVTPPVEVKLIDGVNHMGIVSSPAAVSIIADDVAKAGSGS